MQTHWVDGHVDLTYIALGGRNILKECSTPEEECISIPDLKNSHVKTIAGTIYTSPGDHVLGYDSSENRDAAFSQGKKQLDLYRDLHTQGHINLLHTNQEVPPNSDALEVILLMEGADPIRNIDDVAWWHEQGLRIVGLTWSVGTRYAGGNNCKHGLTSEGKALVSALDAHNILHDASHLSEQSFEDLVSCTDTVIIASHSNSRNLLQTDSQRNLLDEQAKEIFNRGGVIGLNLCTMFLSKTFSKKPQTATINDCVEHIFHLCDLAGNRSQIALGSDFDGGFTPKHLPIGLKHPSQLPTLLQQLQDNGFSEDELHSFAHGAWERLYKIN
ncbi:MAG TPA: membrane dipeptidase [Phycisphaerales bacterium]|nr:membrane dipeptidase [Phycisphaerales bacterium]